MGWGDGDRLCEAFNGEPYPHCEVLHLGNPSHDRISGCKMQLRIVCLWDSGVLRSAGTYIRTVQFGWV